MLKTTLLLQTVRRKREHRPGSSSDYPVSGTDRPLVENLEKPEGDGFSKIQFSVLADHPGCTTGPFATDLSDI
jgi:hypothetical protein